MITVEALFSPSFQYQTMSMAHPQSRNETQVQTLSCCTDELVVSWIFCFGGQQGFIFWVVNFLF